MRTRVTTNANQVTKNLTANVVRAEKLIKQTVDKSTRLVMNTAKIGIQSPPKSGVSYTKGGVTHKSSAKGEYPATDTGFLVSNIAYEVRNFVGRVTSSAPYSKHLEYGTTNMSARPFMFPSLEKNRRKIVKMFKDASLISR
jgi:HK97 gp10 family phage protein